MGKDKKKKGGKGIVVLLFLVGLAAVAVAGIAQFKPELLDSVRFVKDQLAGDLKATVRYATGGGGLGVLLFSIMLGKPKRKK